VALDVVGNTKLSGSLILENPGGFTTINNQKFLVERTDGVINRYDISAAKYGPVNFVEYVFNDLNFAGLQDFNTKVPVDEYVMSLQGNSFVETVGAPTYERVYFNRNSGADVVNGLIARAYKKGTPGNQTWWLQFYCNNSNFYYDYLGTVNVNLTLTVVIYRKNLLTNSGATITVDMGSNFTATAAKPTGY